MQNSTNSGTRPRNGMRRLWPAALAMLWISTSSGCGWPRNSSVIVVPDSGQVIFLDPNQPESAPWPAVILSRGRYLELVEAQLRMLAERPE